MRTQLRTALALAFLALPSAASASEILMWASGGRELEANFGLVSFGLGADSFDVRSDAGLLYGFEGTLNIADGPPLRVRHKGDSTTYTYGPGTVEMIGWWEPVEGDDVFGRFTAELDGFTLTVCEGCDDFWDASSADGLSLWFGPLHFDDEVASALGIPTVTAGGNLYIDYLEDIDGDHRSRFRSGFSNTGNGELTLDLGEYHGAEGGGEGEGGVPEPGTVTLLATALAAGLARRGHRPRAGYRGAERPVDAQRSA